jgi:two-component system, OmpR family, sensor histidine kinase KdpD
MNGPERPNPDALLASIQRSEKTKQRGTLKIFFGMCAGVGKTYAMLRAGQALKGRNISVCVGIVETHGRKETEALLSGLSIIPRANITYKGKSLSDLDLDAVLAVRPAYALVDELAHTNAEGMRHSKRYQDVLELLDNGINVITTLNVQHVESLVDSVRQITGITVRETVPDSVLDMADEIELVDLPPDDLLTRLKEGKVYTEERSEAAAEHFFQKGNLTALREIALRTTADRVNLQLRDYMQENRISGPWKTKERLMVAVGPSPYSEQLIRWTRRIASTMEASWIAVYVQASRPLSETAEKRLKKNIALAQELGATLVTTADDDIAQALLRVANQNNATQIVIGKSMTNPVIDLVHGGSLVNKLIRESGAIDIYVVKSDAGIPPKKPFPNGMFSGIASPMRDYIVSCSAVCAATAVCFLASSFIDYRSVGMFLLFIISLLSLFIGRGPLFATAALSAVFWDFFFIHPIFTFSILHPSDVLMVSLYFIVALVSGTLTSRIRIKETVVRHRERQTSALYSFVNNLAAAETTDDIVRVGIENITTVFGAHAALFLPDLAGSVGRKPHPLSTFAPDTEKEWSVAEWVFSNKKPAGHTTATLPFATATYYPLLMHGACRGVVGLVLPGVRERSVEQEGLLAMFLHQWAFALDRAVLREEAARTRLLEESERLNKTLLNSISHELRTPLAAITGASSSLLEPAVVEDRHARDILVGDIRAASSRLNRLVENLLDMTRIESGGLTMAMEWCDVHDIINAVLGGLSEELSRHTVRVTITDDVPLVKLDGIIIEQVLSNIVLNAAQYTPPGTPIHIKSFFDAGSLVFVIEDEGPGLPEESIHRIFDKFYRVPGSKAGGTGLGLSIVKGFVELHGGSVEAVNRIGKGAQLLIRLPVEHKPFLTDEAS